MGNVIEVRNVSKSFRRKKVLQDIDCKLENGIYGMLGPNGAGKTTLIRCITGLYSFGGQIKINEVDVSRKKSHEIGYLPQKFGVFTELKVKQMMQYFCNIKKVPKKEWKKIIQDCLQKVNLEEQENTVIRKLSGGMIRRLGIAQSLIGDPKVILLDEPTAGLDPEERMRFKTIITNLSKEQIIIVSTHIVEDIEACCDHIIIMDQGRLIKLGDIDEIRNYASGRILELTEEQLQQSDNILFVEKSYIWDRKKVFRVIMKDTVENALLPTVEDGYLCLLKES